jgi:hypothetical protein
VATIGLALPLLLGLNMELYVLIPFRDLDNKPPTIDPLQDWAFGIVLLNILHGTITILPENHLQQLLNRVRMLLICLFMIYHYLTTSDIGIWRRSYPCQYSTSYKVHCRPTADR